MIYTNGLDLGTKWILVYWMNTPTDIVYLNYPFNGNVQAWKHHVNIILDNYSNDTGFPRKELSARPIKDYYHYDS